MKAGYFNINDYLDRLYENAEEEEKKSEESEKSGQFGKSKPQSSKTDFMDGGEDLNNAEGIIIPDVNKKSYDWLKKEYQKGQTEVKVEMKIGDAKFEPGYDLQTDLKSVKDFKPGMYGEVKTADTGNGKPGDHNMQKPADSNNKPNNLDPKKDSGQFGKTEGNKPQENNTQSNGQKTVPPKTNDQKDNINKEDHKTEKEEEKEEEKKSNGKPEIKKIDLKTKKK